jgi:prevent-host-death family protein
MPRTISATDARVRFGRLLRDVAEKGEIVLVEKSGRPRVVVLPIAEYHRLRQLEPASARWQRLLDQAIEQVDRDRAGKRLPPPDEIIRAMRGERDEQLLDLP